MPTEALTPEILRGGEISARRFDPRSAAPFIYKSTSEETRRAYRRTLLEFFRFVGMRHPADVVPAEVLRWRDTLRSQWKSAATVSFKLSVVRSFFEHLRARRTTRGSVAKNILAAISSGFVGDVITISGVARKFLQHYRRMSDGSKCRHLNGDLG